MPEIVDYRFRLRRGLAATWAATNDVLLDGEFGLERDTGKLKIGDGVTPWNTLPYLESGLELALLADVDTSARADGRLLAWDAAASKHRYVAPSSGGGGRTLLYSKTLSANGNFDTNETWPGGTLPNNYYKYEIEMGMRPVDAGSPAVLLALNGDATNANYRQTIMYGNSGAAGANSTDERFIGSCNAALPGVFTKNVAYCLAPGAAHHKEFVANYGRRDSATAFYAIQQHLIWGNTAAINRMQFTSAGASGNFVAGSFVHIFGV